MLGVCGFLVEAVYRLAVHAVESLHFSLSLGQWTFAIGWTALLLYFEGYRGFQQRFSPRVVARAWHLGHHPRWLHVVLAPAFCIGLFHASPRRVRSEWTLVVMVVALVVLVRRLEPLLRGLFDLGVVVALSWGLGALVVFAARGLTGRVPAVPLDLPGPATSAATPVLARD